ncbi:MAG: sugar phosphate nucleotidyltransferase [Archangium gephyra]|uniref:Sugar phosphate nucleotidyltransferase n=1 Tax=Archangium gephyra TaxID=48 RepID=A0A2W5SSZ7_9BACT|nr:MAG: sugar phosphate nucleotidyltransferase [Archangium gephyra]
MHPRTLTIPKSMLPVNGRPFVDWQLEKLRDNGFDACVFCVGHMAEQIEAHVGDGARFGVRVTYAHEGQQRLGTGGALRAALEHLEPEFVLTYGDSYLPFDYLAPLGELRARPDCEVVMSVFHNRNELEPSNVALRNGLVARYEKGSKEGGLEFIDYGALALRRRFVEAITPGQSDLSAALGAAVKRGEVRAVEAHRRFFEVGSHAGLAALEAELEGTKR